MNGAGAAVVASLVLFAGAAGAGPAAAQPARPTERAERAEATVRLEAGVAFSTPLLVDGNGTRVRLAPAPLAGVSLAHPSWRAGGVSFAAEVRLSTASVRLEDAGARWSGGRAWQAELLATGRLARWERVVPRAGVGVGWIGGIGDVELVRHLGRRPRPVVEGGVELRRGTDARTALALGAQGIPVSPPGGDPGGVLRVILAVRHAW